MGAGVLLYWGDTPRHGTITSSICKIGVVGDGRRPVGENTEDTDVFGQCIDHFVHVTAVVDYSLF